MRASDIAILLTLVVAFATFVTAHICIAVGLFARAQRGRALLGFLVAPLAPYWAIRARMYVRGASWIVGAFAYVVARALAK